MKKTVIIISLLSIIGTTNLFAEKFNYDAFIAKGKTLIYTEEAQCLNYAKTKEDKLKCKKIKSENIKELYKKAFEMQKEEYITNLSKRIEVLKKQYDYIINQLENRRACISVANSWKDIIKCRKKTKIILKKHNKKDKTSKMN